MWVCLHLPKCFPTGLPPTEGSSPQPSAALATHPAQSARATPVGAGGPSPPSLLPAPLLARAQLTGRGVVEGAAAAHGWEGTPTWAPAAAESCRHKVGLGGGVAMRGAGRRGILSSGGPRRGASVWSRHLGTHDLCDHPTLPEGPPAQGSSSAGLWQLPGAPVPAPSPVWSPRGAPRPGPRSPIPRVVQRRDPEGPVMVPSDTGTASVATCSPGATSAHLDPCTPALWATGAVRGASKQMHTVGAL